MKVKGFFRSPSLIRMARRRSEASSFRHLVASHATAMNNPNIAAMVAMTCNECIFGPFERSRSNLGI